MYVCIGVGGRGDLPATMQQKRTLSCWDTFAVSSPHRLSSFGGDMHRVCDS